MEEPMKKTLSIAAGLAALLLVEGPCPGFDINRHGRFGADPAPATPRAGVINVFNVRGWDVSANSSYEGNDHRRFLLISAADL
jgi:hypothetical protein